jgi:hypothetical protein
MVHYLAFNIIQLSLSPVVSRTLCELVETAAMTLQPQQRWSICLYSWNLVSTHLGNIQAGSGNVRHSHGGLTNGERIFVVDAAMIQKWCSGKSAIRWYADRSVNKTALLVGFLMLRLQIWPSEKPW